MNFAEVGLRPIVTAGVTTPASINASYTLVKPTTAQRLTSPGTMYCFITMEGTITARYTTNGVTPTTTVGNLLPAATATIPTTLTLRGEELITAFRIIGTANGATITYWFAIGDTR